MTYEDLIAVSSGAAISGTAPAPAPAAPAATAPGTVTTAPAVTAHAVSGGIAILIFGLLALAFGRWAGGK